MNRELLKKILQECRELTENQNISDRHHWVKNIKEKHDGFHYSLIKGMTAHFVCYQNGEITPSDFRRTRTGFWTRHLGHVYSLRGKLGGRSFSDQIEKYVRGLGYIYRKYGHGERIDCILHEKALLSIWFFSHKPEHLELEMEIRHSQPWPGRKSGLAETISGDSKSFLVRSKLGTTSFRLNTDGRAVSNLKNGTIRIDVSGFTELNIAISEEGVVEQTEDFEKTLNYHSSVDSVCVLETPDARINKLFLWAKHDLLEFYSETDKGNGWFAGFPVFSWFFGRDGLWMGMAANLCGMGKLTKQHMSMLLRHSLNGRIPHEVGLGADETQIYSISDNAVDTRFMSIDSNLLWLICNSTLNISGETGFPDSDVNSVLGFSRSCDKDGDLLLENRFKEGLIGWPETWAAERDGICVDINGLWLEVLKIYDDTGRYYAEAKRRFLDIFYRNGSFVDSVNDGKIKYVKSAMQLIPAMFMDDPEIGYRLQNLSDETLLTPWGVRSVSSSDPMYDGGYHTGTVWPLMTGWYVMAAYRHKLRSLAYQQLLTFVENAFSSEDPGRINETYDSGQPNPTGQFAQGWSSSMFILAVLGGMLGLARLRGNRGSVIEAFDTSLPDVWPEIRIVNFQWHGTQYDMTIRNGIVEAVQSEIRNRQVVS